MPMRGRLARAVTIFLLLSGFSLGWLIFQRRPLITSNSWKGSYTDSGGVVHPVRIYTMLWRPSFVFVSLPEAQISRYRWFSIDTQRHKVAAPNGPGYTPYLYYNQDMPLGIMLDFPKIEDHWTVEWVDRGVHFSNGSLSVHVSHQGA